MNLLREYIRELLTESTTIHPRIMKMIDRLEDEEGGRVKINRYQVLVKDRQMKTLAQVSFDPTGSMYGNCSGASIVSFSEAEGGYGPLAYDIAIEATGGLAPDRTEVSNSARDVWAYYSNNRPDVIKQQMDDLYNRLTPDEKDNCDQNTAEQDDMAYDWKESSLSKVYSKSGTPVIDELRKRGMIKE
jgi:hypothetical protein